VSEHVPTQFGLVGTRVCSEGVHLAPFSKAHK
jgi:hypothetical protein